MYRAIGPSSVLVIDYSSYTYHMQLCNGAVTFFFNCSVYQDSDDDYNPFASSDESGADLVSVHCITQI